MSMLLWVLSAAVIHVAPGESIQNALDVSLAGDTVLLLPGIHTGQGDHLVAMTGAHNGVTLIGSTADPGSVVLHGGGLSGSVLNLDGLSLDTLDRTTVLAGFTVQAGTSAELGGGLFSFHASPEIIAVVFRECHAGSGGGAYIWRGAPRFVSCGFIQNSCNTSGAGMYVYASDAAEILSTVFHGNSTTDDGGGIFLFHSSPLIWNCLFTDNYAWDNGGGVYCYANSSPDIGWCTFSGNSTTYEGSAIYFRVGSAATVHDCVISGNITPALWIDGGGDPQFNHNCIWGNPDGNWGNLPDQTGLNGNISEDPLFTQGFHLSHTAAGQPYTSPCVNSGSTTASNAGLSIYWTRTDQVPDAGQADMGFHYGPQPQHTGIDPGNTVPGLVVSSPSYGVVHVEVPLCFPNGTIEIYDLAGRRIHKSVDAREGTGMIPMYRHPAGVYFLLFTHGDTVLRNTFVLL